MLTVQQDGFDRLPEAEILDRAKELGRVVFLRRTLFLSFWPTSGWPKTSRLEAWCSLINGR